MRSKSSATAPARRSTRFASPDQRNPDEINAAKHGVFNISGVNVKIKRNMNWAYDPVGAESFRARLNDLRWLDTLLYAYRERNDVKALQRAKRIVVDWVENNPLRAPPTDRTWFDKVAGDRAPYIAYVTRAAECEGLLENQNLARKLLGSVQQHVRFLADRDHYSPDQPRSVHGPRPDLQRPPDPLPAGRDEGAQPRRATLHRQRQQQRDPAARACGSSTRPPTSSSRST